MNEKIHTTLALLSVGLVLAAFLYCRWRPKKKSGACGASCGCGKTPQEKS